MAQIKYVFTGQVRGCNAYVFIGRLSQACAFAVGALFAHPKKAISHLLAEVSTSTKGTLRRCSGTFKSPCLGTLCAHTWIKKNLVQYANPDHVVRCRNRPPGTCWAMIFLRARSSDPTKGAKRDSFMLTAADSRIHYCVRFRRGILVGVLRQTEVTYIPVSPSPLAAIIMRMSIRHAEAIGDFFHALRTAQPKA